MMSWELPPSHQGQRTWGHVPVSLATPTLHHRGGHGSPLPNRGASGNSDHCTLHDHFPSTLPVAFSSRTCSAFCYLLAFYEHSHEVPQEAHSHVLGPAHPKVVVAPSLSGPADSGSFNSLPWPPSDIDISRRSACSVLPVHLSSTYLVQCQAFQGQRMSASRCGFPTGVEGGAGRDWQGH